MIFKTYCVRNACKTLFTGLAFVSLLALLSGCTAIKSFIPLPDEQRYARIDMVKNQLEYEAAGYVIKESSDHNSTSLESSYWQAQVRGKDAFSLLTNRLKTVPNVKCSTMNSQTSSCTTRYLDILVTRDDNASPLVTVTINDRLGGKIRN